MALISCPECGRQVSDKAVACPDCGYPIASNRPDGDVLIRIGDFTKNGGAQWAMRSLTVIIRNHETNDILAQGNQRSTVRIHLESPTTADFYVQNIGKGYHWCTEVLKPGKKYEFKQFRKTFTIGYQLNEVDHIDAD